MKTLAEIDPEVLAEIFGHKPIEIPKRDISQSRLTPQQRELMEKAFEEEGICVCFFPSAPKPDSPEGAEDGGVSPNRRNFLTRPWCHSEVYPILMSKRGENRVTIGSDFALTDALP